MFLTLLHKYICNNIRCGFPPKLVPDFETGNARTKIHLQTGSSEAKDMRFPQHKGLTCVHCVQYNGTKTDDHVSPPMMEV